MLRILLPSVLLLASVAHALDVTSCGQTVPSFDTGILQTDLVCPNPNTGDDCLAATGAPAGVDLQANATLQLNGHTITGGCFGVRALLATSKRPASIQGPGLITGSFFGIFFIGRLTISDVTLDANGAGVVSPGSSTNHSRLIATNVVANNSVGPFEGSGLSAYRIDATSVTTNGNVSAGISVESRLRATNVQSNNNGHGVFGLNKIRIDGLTATNNVYNGVFCRKLRLLNATVTGSQSGVDLNTRSRPSLTNVTCDHSSFWSSTPIPWGVCAGD